MTRVASVFFLLLLSAPVFAAPPEGSYYEPETDPVDGPEMLAVIDDGIFKQIFVYNGATVIVESKYSVSGNKIIVSSPGISKIYNCNGRTIQINSEPSSRSLAFEDVNGSLMFETDTGTVFFYRQATAEQIAKIYSLPRCD